MGCSIFDGPTGTTMRNVFLSLALVASAAASAQIDLSKIMAGQGMKMEDDNSPFVPNSFVGSFRMEMHMYRNGIEEKHSPTNMRYWSSTDMTLHQMVMPERKGQDMKVLTDLKGKWQYMLMTDDKGRRTAMKSRKKTMVMEERAQAPLPKVTVTGETREIEGHLCTKIVAISPEGTWTGWVAGDLKAPFEDMARNMRKESERMMKGANGIEGMPLEFEFVNAKGDEKLVCNFRELQMGAPDAGLFSLEGYEVTEMPGFGQQR